MGNPQLDIDLVGVALLCVAVVACQGTKLAGPSRPHEVCWGVLKSLLCRQDLLCFPTKAGGPWLTFQLTQWVFLISQKGGEVHIDLWTPVLLPPLGHSCEICEIVPPRLKRLGSHSLPCSSVLGKAGDGGIGIVNRPRCAWSSVWSVASR